MIRPERQNRRMRCVEGRARALVLVAIGIGACSRRGIVGITATRAVERDATTPLPDPADGRDAATYGRDAAVPGSVTTIDGCLPVNAANLDPDSTQRLLDGTGDTAAMHFLYPYDGTVYPQGIPGPLLMWDGPAADVVYVRLRSSGFDYRGCLKPTAPNRLELPQGVWAAAAVATRGSRDPFTLELKTLAGQTIYGPVSEELVIANGALPGSVYYMTYPVLTPIGTIMRIRGGGTAEVLLGPPNCTGCHSVSTSGNRLLAYSTGFGKSFTVTDPGPVAPLPGVTPGAEFSAIYPDGSLYVAGAHPLTGAGTAGPKTFGGGVTTAGLYDTSTGALLSGGGVPGGATMPAFSPDGSRLVFTDYDASAGQTLALMSFSVSTRTASGYQSLYTTPGRLAGWPTFLPDGNGVVFTLGDSSEFSGGGVGIHPSGPPGPATDLYLVDVATHAATLLSRAMGFRSDNELEPSQTYLPGGAMDLHQNYYPTVSPSPSGGYAWVFFDSFRTYGNQGAHRSIWGTAITLSPDGTYASDPSHPAFFLPGQDLATPNFRSVAALDD